MGGASGLTKATGVFRLWAGQSSATQALGTMEGSLGGVAPQWALSPMFSG